MFSTVVDRITEYLKIKGQQIKLEIVSRSARLLSHVIVVGLLTVLGLFFLFFTSFGFSVLLNELFESAYLGYLIVAGVYFLVILLIAILGRAGVIQRWIETVIINAIDQMEEDE